jgi:hypothetical protein
VGAESVGAFLEIVGATVSVAGIVGVDAVRALQVDAEVKRVGAAVGEDRVREMRFWRPESTRTPSPVLKAMTFPSSPLRQCAPRQCRAEADGVVGRVAIEHDATPLGRGVLPSANTHEVALDSLKSARKTKCPPRCLPAMTLPHCRGARR